MTSYPMTLRRLRRSPAIRDLVAPVLLSTKQLIQPFFLNEGLARPEELPSLAGQFRHTPDSLKKAVECMLESGVSTALLFPVPVKKLSRDFNYDFESQVISNLKKTFGDSLTLFMDVCLCSQTSDGQCGISGESGIPDNDATVKELVKKSLVYAHAGADGIAPSDMMDSRIKAMREVLPEQTLLMSYSAKFASAFYGPFRDAANSAPKAGDRKNYQINLRNPDDAIRSSLRDLEEGADILMVKPAGPNLDIISKIKNHPSLAHAPLAAYQVSGEWQALHLLAQNNLGDFNSLLLESLYGMKRAGADILITYGATGVRELL